MHAEEVSVTPASSVVTPEAVVMGPNDDVGKVNPNPGNELLYKQTIDNHTEEIEKLKRDLISERLNNITIFGVFASLVTFLSVEIQAFKNIENFWLLIGLSAFLVSCFMLFIFSIYSIARDRLSWRAFFSTPIFWLFLLFLIFSFAIFLLNSQGINVNIRVSS